MSLKRGEQNEREKEDKEKKRNNERERRKKVCWSFFIKSMRERQLKINF